MMEHEHSLRAELDPAWAVRPVELTQHEGQTALILEDPGGEPLDQLVGTPMEMGQFLRVAIGLSVAVRRLHGRGVIHKDLKPANIIIEPSTGQVWLMGFGIASRLPRERQSAEPPEFIAGTLAYMAPEQTGRMNRSIDSRSDLYALGVTLYEMLTGTLPFTASDPMEWVHCHIAKQPLAPAERRKDVPHSVSGIITKLLAKTTEERYQTAAGLESDLRRCLAELAAGFILEAGFKCSRSSNRVYHVVRIKPGLIHLLLSAKLAIRGLQCRTLISRGLSALGHSKWINGRVSCGKRAAWSSCNSNPSKFSWRCFSAAAT